jgi:alpha-glucosidase
MHGIDLDIPWWRGAVIYQIYPLSFADSNGDGFGDLPGIEAHLDHVAWLGADAVWLSPVFRSPMRDWGYDVSGHTEIDPLFGTLDDLDRVIARAHALGLRILLDQVWSHTSDQHPWFAASRQARSGPFADWYVWADPAPDGSPPNNWLSVFGGAAWRWEPRRRQYYLYHFLESQPKLNLRNPAVVAAILEIGQFWLERGIDGFRLDAVDFLLHDAGLRSNPPAPVAEIPLKPFGMQIHRYDMMQEEARGVICAIRALTDRYPGTVTLAELSSQPGAYARIADYTGSDGFHLGYTLRLLRGAFSASLFADALIEGADAIAAFSLCWGFGNHDVVRAATRWGSDNLERLRLAIYLMAALPGTLCLYQGDELGLPEAVLEHQEIRDPFGIAYWPDFVGRDGARTPMPWRGDLAHGGFTGGSTPWLPVPDAHLPLAVDNQTRDPGSILNIWRECLSWRKTCTPVLYGTVEHVATQGPVLAFERVFESERILCVFNLGSEPAVWNGSPSEVALEPWAFRFLATKIALIR